MSLDCFYGNAVKKPMLLVCRLPPPLQSFSVFGLVTFSFPPRHSSLSLSQCLIVPLRHLTKPGVPIVLVLGNPLWAVSRWEEFRSERREGVCAGW